MLVSGISGWSCSLGSRTGFAVLLCFAFKLCEGKQLLWVLIISNEFNHRGSLLGAKFLSLQQDFLTKMGTKCSWITWRDLSLQLVARKSRRISLFCANIKSVPEVKEQINILCIHEMVLSQLPGVLGVTCLYCKKVQRILNNHLEKGVFPYVTSTGTGPYRVWFLALPSTGRSGYKILCKSVINRVWTCPKQGWLNDCCR